MTDTELDQAIAEEVFGLSPCTFEIDGQFSAWATSWKCEHDTNYMGKCYPANEEAINHPHSPLEDYCGKDYGLVLNHLTYELGVRPTMSFGANGIWSVKLRGTSNQGYILIKAEPLERAVAEAALLWVRSHGDA